MDKNSRTGKTIRNTMVTMLCQFVYLLLSFICRTIFTNMLGAEYLGINGLFTNILTILSFAELGFGSALVYRMYAPLANNDFNKVRQYLRLYKKVYNVILIVITVIGVLLIPALPYFVEAPNVKENLTLLYVLYLIQTLVSYVYVYKKSVLIADQKNYIVNIYTQVFNILMNVAQCAFLVISHDFVIYCMINIACNLLNNVFCSIRANKEYPYITETVEGTLTDEEVKGLITDVKGLLLTKVASTAFSGTDNIFISAFIGIKYVGILSNYTMLFTIINTVMNKVFDSVTSSIGNLVVTGNKKQTEQVLKRIFFLNTSLYGYVCIGMLLLLREFVTKIWFSNEYAMAQSLITLILIEFFFRSIHYPLYTTRNAMGCFSQYKWVFGFAAVLNICLDFVLVKPMGVSGLYLATILCRGITYFVDVWVIYHMEFEKSAFSYFKLIIQWLIFLSLCGVVLTWIFSFVGIEGICGFAIKILITTLVYAGFYFSIYSHTEEFCYFWNILQNLTKMKRGKKDEIRNSDIS
ncbi:oligosaccharide flippase family protein [Desulfosporosinus sp. FKA]|uniref:lipopolysaccharide biosynthesis protein n=1 Tax=Desulfosporosinus sp. FKA TaxID=1969834 RepID=UPI000B4A47A5|nr:oligosaccharide flippase family protein [Desulfosporosinus sp. FKA]